MGASTPPETGRLELATSGGVAAGGDAIGRLADGRVVFVEAALPGERVTVKILQRRRDYLKGRVSTVLQASPERRIPPCANVARGCGGCGWQHISGKGQLELKEAVVLDCLRRIAHLDARPLLAPARRLPGRGYRTSARVAVDPSGALAYRERGSHRLVRGEGCLVVHERLAELLSTVRLPGQNKASLRVGLAGGERLVVLGLPAGPGVVVPPEVTLVAPGEGAVLYEEVAGRRWRVSARSFFQAGPAGAELLVEAVDEAVGESLGETGRLIDAYGGVGLLGGVVASRRGAALTCVEADPGAASDARANLADLGARVVAREVGRWRPPRADVVVADPARSGLGRPGVGALAASGAGVLVLASCDPASLARDTTLLSGAGFVMTSLRVLDLFPGTPHVEAVARFERSCSELAPPADSNPYLG